MKIFKWEVAWAKYAVGAFVLLFLVGLANECRGDILISSGPSYENEVRLLHPEGLALEISKEYKGWMVASGYNGNVPYITGLKNVHLGLAFLGLGLAINDENENLPKWWNFSLAGGVDIKKCRITFRHFSNAGIKSPNKGENWLLFGCKI